MVPLRQPPSPLLPILLFCDVSWALEKWQRSLWGQALSSNSFPELWPAGKCARGNRKAVSGERSHLWAYSTTDPAFEDWECLALYVPGDNSGANVVGGGTVTFWLDLRPLHGSEYKSCTLELVKSLWLRTAQVFGGIYNWHFAKWTRSYKPGQLPAPAREVSFSNE